MNWTKIATKRWRALQYEIVKSDLAERYWVWYRGRMLGMSTSLDAAKEKANNHREMWAVVS